jgi:lipopolysaccharide export LptBFGC system permease protein LptF
VKFFSAIDRYIFRLVLMPMLGIFLLAASLLVLDKMLRLFDFVATEGGPVGVVFKMLANLLPEYASLAIPLGLMLGILLAFRKLATSSELDVMRAVGLSYTRLLRVPYILTILFAGLNFAIVGYLQPLSRYYYEELKYELKSGALGASIKVGEFTALKDRIALRIDESRDDGRRLIGIFARVANAKGQVLSISAQRGAVSRAAGRARYGHPPALAGPDHSGHAGQHAACAQFHQSRPADRPPADREVPPARRGRPRIPAARAAETGLERGLPGNSASPARRTSITGWSR